MRAPFMRFTVEVHSWGMGLLSLNSYLQFAFQTVSPAVSVYLINFDLTALHALQKSCCIFCSHTLYWHFRQFALQQTCLI